MRKICSLFLSVVGLMMCSPILFGEPLHYRKEGRELSVHEEFGWYVVECLNTTPAGSSRNKNIQDRRYRIEAIDLIGAYILFLQSPFKSAPDLFQLFADATQLHYTAFLSELKQEEKNGKDGRITIYRCKKENYHISEATYQKNVNMAVLLRDNYRHRKDAASVELLVKYGILDVGDWLEIERDFLTGNSSLPGLIRELHTIPDRLELSILMNDDPVGKYKEQIPEETCYRIFYLEEVVTALPVGKKESAYQLWANSLESAKGALPELLRFCVKRREKTDLPPDPVFTDVIEAYPGAISPFGSRAPMNKTLYDEAVIAYSESDFHQAKDLLFEYTNENGLQPEALNLLGATLRYLGEPARAISYFLLCLKYSSSTTYLLGNLALTLRDMDYPALPNLSETLLPLAKDDWSKKELKAIISNK